jgi:hypothetical protein
MLSSRTRDAQISLAIPFASLIKSFIIAVIKIAPFSFWSTLKILNGVSSLRPISIGREVHVPSNCDGSCPQCSDLHSKDLAAATGAL